jgi:hypothetical protein
VPPERSEGVLLSIARREVGIYNPEVKLQFSTGIRACSSEDKTKKAPPERSEE